MGMGDELRVVLLLVVVWATERCCKRINVSPIIGQILAGLVVGPALLDVIVHVEAFRLLGKLGVMLLVIESGLAVDVNHVRRFGPRASFAALTGVLFPTLLSFALYAGILGMRWKTALAIGAAISPTSLGFSAQLLSEVGELSTPMGHLICTAAVIDDVLSLLLLAEIEALGDDDASKVYIYVLPILASLGSLLVGGVATVVMKSKTDELSGWLTSLNSHRRERVLSTNYPEPADGDRDISKNGQGNVDTQPLPLEILASGSGAMTPAGAHADPFGLGDRVLLGMVLGISLAFGYLSALVGSSDLLGCFLGGLAFAGVPGVQAVWQRQMKRHTQWGARLFFSATIAFSVPSIYKNGGLLRLKPFWKGMALTIAAVLGKLAVGVFAGPPLTLTSFSILGWAMNGRGEFSFYIAEAANERGILTSEDFSAVVWALLVSSVAAPIAFRQALFKGRRAEAELGEGERRTPESAGDGDLGASGTAASDGGP